MDEPDATLLRNSPMRSTPFMLAYASSRVLKPFPAGLPLSALILFFYFLLLALAPQFFDEPYFGAPRWLGRVIHDSLLLAFVSSLVALCALILISFRYRTKAQLTMVVAVSSMCLLTPVLWCMAEDNYFTHSDRHRGWVRLSADLRGIAQSSAVYANDNSGHHPPHLAMLMLTNQIAPRSLCGFELVPYSLAAPPPRPEDWSTIASDVDAHSEYTYTGADLNDRSMLLDSAIIIAYSRPTRVLPGHHLLAFVDARVELVKDTDLPGYFAASNAARSTLGLPPFTLGGPPPPPP